MDFNYVVSPRTAGANPFQIFDFLATLDPDQLCWALKHIPYKQFLNTSYWFAVSHTAKARAGMRCQVCNGRNGLEVHHRTYDTLGMEHFFMNDLVVLDNNCHGLFHGHIQSSPPTRVITKQRIKTIRIEPHDKDDIKIPEQDEIILTKELIDNCRANGSFTNATIRAFGLTDKRKGWTFRLIGKKMTREQYRAAVESKFVYNSGRL